MSASIRETWEEAFVRFHRLDTESRNEVDATDELSHLYTELHSTDQRAIDDLLAEWLLSVDEVKRYDALALVRRHDIDSALPALRRLVDVAQADTSPRGADLLDHVSRVLGSLGKDP